MRAKVGSKFTTMKIFYIINLCFLVADLKALANKYGVINLILDIYISILKFSIAQNKSY